MSELDNSLKLKCGRILPNRFALAPLTNKQSNLDGTVGEDEIKWLETRAGSFGLISTCAAFISLEGKAWKGQLGVASNKHLIGLKETAKRIKLKGSIAIVQIHHGGSKADLSENKISTVDQEGVKGASIDDIQRITEDFVNAACLAEMAGFDGIEVHGANGYLFTQFLSPIDNTRTDDYGGDLIGRAKFLRETVRNIRKNVSKNFIVNVRISPVDVWDNRGLIIEDSVQVSKWLAEDGVDVIHLSLKDAESLPPNSDKSIVRLIREAVPKEIKIAVAGGILTRKKAERVSNNGADIIVLGKGAIIHPNWPEVSKQTNFTPLETPWTVEYLKSVAVGTGFLEYLMQYPGWVVGGNPPRG